MTSKQDYRQFAGLSTYIDRIGAEQLNFRRFMVKEHKGKYYVERSLITLHPDGTIHCTNPDHEPTDAEREVIRLEISKMDWPKAILATSAQYSKLVKQLGKSITYPFHSRKQGGGIIMVQERRETAEGKRYIPWTMFSDGEWRPMEPDGKLPFFKPMMKSSNRIMIHEGAKAAMAAASVGPDHPWYEELKEYEHWGLIGGALAPHRADYDELLNEKPIEVVYVCDNDTPGIAAITQVSKYWGRSLKKIVFGSDFPLAWDMADHVPRSFFSESGNYNGPMLRDLMNPATRATFMMPNPKGKGRDIAVLTNEFKDEWLHTISPECYIHKEWPHRLYGQKEFDSLVRPFSDVAETSALLKARDESKAARMRYMPNLKPGVYSTRDGITVNNFQPSAIQPKNGDISLWLDYLKHFIPDPFDRDHTMKWIATLIARPAVRMTYSLLLISEEHGIGKNTLSDTILRPLVGEWNTSCPSGKDIAGSGFNSWVARKRLVIISEIYAGHDSRVYDQLKTIISDSTVQVNEKFVKEYTEDNWAHIVASSNSLRALKLDDHDRRWLVPRLGNGRPHEFWREFNNWLKYEQGLNKIAWWAEDYVKKHGAVQAGEHSPTTQLKRDMITAGYSPGQMLVQEMFQRIIDKMGDQPWVVLDTQMVEFIKQRLYDGRHSDRLERPMTIRRVAERMGLHTGKKNEGCQAWGIVKSQAIVISNSQDKASLTPKRLSDQGFTPLKLLDFYQI